MTNLEMLNVLLKDKSSDCLELPDFRRTVPHSGSNLPWLRKVLLGKVSGELHRLLSMSDKELKGEYRSPASLGLDLGKLVAEKVGL